MFVLFSLVLILGSCRHAAAYVNALDAEFSFSCGTSEQTISHVESVHDNHAEDRQFDFSCRDVMAEMDGTKAACYWTGYANVFDQPENFQCPGNQYVNGMGSQHNNHYEDRIWKFRCCSLPDVNCIIVIQIFCNVLDTSKIRDILNQTYLVCVILLYKWQNNQQRNQITHRT
ncbi:DERM-like protein, partial [Mya arenaria]